MDSILPVRQVIREASVPISSVFGIRKLPNHADVVVFSALAFWGVQIIVGPATGRAVLGERSWKGWKERDRNNWNIHVVSLVHAMIIVPLAFGRLDLHSLLKDKAFGWHERVGDVLAIACGYFLWDTIESLVHYSDIGFVIHGLACFLIYLLVLTPFIAYYGPRFLLWELSTPFLNIHWFLDKLNMTGSAAQVVNGVALLATFAGVRLIYGTYMSYEFWQTLYEIRHDVPLAIRLVYGVGNVVLNGLNWFWFAKMIAALRKRMAPSGHGQHGKDIANGKTK